jgi:PAS domain S-box-containing protein
MQNITLKYRSALIVLALVSLIAQFLVQFFIFQQKNDSTWINISGKQRMLSQKTAKLVLLQSKEFHLNYAIELKKTLFEWKTAHNKILNLEVQSTWINDFDHNERVILLKKIDHYFNLIYSEATKLTNKNSTPSVSTLLAVEPMYLSDMDKLVKNYEKLAQKKLWLLSRLELTLFFLTILVLLIEAKFVFKPAIEFIKKQFDELHYTKKKLEESLQEKSKLNAALKSSLNDLEAINYSLEGATTMITMNENGIISTANQNFYQFTNLLPDQVIGKRMTDLMVNPTQPEFLSHLWQELRNGKVWTNEFKLIRKGKDPTLVDVTIIPVFNLLKKINFYIALMIDISGRIDNRLSIQKEQSQLIIYGQEKERKRIAIELHDGLGQILTGLKFTLESIKIKDNDLLKNQLDSIKDLVVQTIQESRRISSNLMPMNLEKYGLNGALIKLVETLTLSNTIEITLVIPKSIPRQEEVNELNIYRIVQELLNNAMKHAHATWVEINIKILGQKLHLYIQDNGQGLFENKISSYGLGLNSIKQRIEDVEGQFFITNPNSIGTLVHCIIPLIYNQNINKNYD